ncbi:hypothetical protein M409DRAFT_36274 [Zasmidium cellare ATCC 36951]|uniref:Enoyl reductase (ER) domain-containing protein n=1 Tax=Zasmidium cellare ATCC 36951 TaxID=1080233 RepID=A0A6A6CU30_ZASCE|nr:uncharacterized protein M409DRAFT_36274 [Zasmidium cellare ATCC 36951]KAF2168986.1 hypothetical protein M409DRAFT_36274 [Zasmidium cellare ATCC 36951]
MSADTFKAWRVTGTKGWDDLVLTERKSPVLGQKDVLVKWRYASLNYRDLIIPLGQYPFPITPGVVAGSDAAGEVISCGEQVTLFKPGDRVISLSALSYQTGPFKPHMIPTILGSAVDGPLQEYSTMDENALIRMPQSLDFEQASTLTTAASTAWNAFFALGGRKLKPGDWVLIQGTGGVSLFGLQFAKAVGAQVIATSSSEAKCQLLREQGADHVINYKECSTWGEEAKKISGEGVQHLLEIGGAGTLAQALEAIAPAGVISLIGFASGFANSPSIMDILLRSCIVRGTMVGSKEEIVETNDFIDANGIKPKVDPAEFELSDLKNAYEYMWAGKHFGKVTVKIS